MNNESVSIKPEAGKTMVSVDVLGQLTDEHYHGPKVFEKIMNFGQFFEELRNHQMLPAERWVSQESLRDAAQRVEIVSFTHPENKNSVKQLTQIANLSDNPVDDPQIRGKYQTILNQVCQPLVTDIQTRKTNGEEIIGIAVLNGGLLIQEYYNLPPEARGQIVEKRLDYKDEDDQKGMAVGVSDFRLPKAISEFTGSETLLVYEDCTAIGISCMCFLRHLKELQEKQGLKFGKVEFHFAVATQQGIVNILRTADELGIQIVVKAGEIVYGLNENFYLKRVPKEKDLYGNYYQGNEAVVGDMGAFGAALPAEYNEVCPWNAKRNGI